MVEKKTCVYLLLAEKLFKFIENKSEKTVWIKNNWQFSLVLIQKQQRSIFLFFLQHKINFDLQNGGKR